MSEGSLHFHANRKRNCTKWSFSLLTTKCQSLVLNATTCTEMGLESQIYKVTSLLEDQQADTSSPGSQPTTNNQWTSADRYSGHTERVSWFISSTWLSSWRAFNQRYHLLSILPEKSCGTTRQDKRILRSRGRSWSDCPPKWADWVGQQRGHGYQTPKNPYLHGSKPGNWTWTPSNENYWKSCGRNSKSKGFLYPRCQVRFLANQARWG